MKLGIGFKFYKQHESLGQKYWRQYEIVGSCYGLDGGSHFQWKTREDVLKRKKYLQIMSLPYPNENGLPGMYNDMKNSQLAIYWKPTSELIKEIEEDMKLMPEHRKFIFD